ncbi:MAG TPA: class I SAM-dependent methyltransferase, partial [Solirubrobacteraceae bacterium]|nr:class I SAM-dependent methyltransferase [Solirubrobacteraceae bacterium]
MLALLPEGGVCAEIGTWRGDNAARILSSRRPRQLYLVDPWEYRTEDKYEQAWFGRRARSGQQDMDAIYESVVDRFRSDIDNGQVVVKRQRSIDAAASFADDALDWVYIDGDHSYEGVKGDLEAYYRTVKSGGFLAGDDYENAGWWGDADKR